ncbi:MAG: chemotaxis protein CheB [Myxococcaceae bacterium]
MNESIEKTFPVVCIGASAGGLESIVELLEGMPVDTEMAFVCIQQLDRMSESLLPAILGRATLMPTLEVKDGMQVERNHVYVIPPNTVMTVSKGILRLTPRSHDGHGVNMCIDTFLFSLAKEQSSLGIGIILSGTGNDGSAGIIALKEAGGITFAQDEETAKYKDMPCHAKATGCVDFVLSPRAIALKLETFPSLLSHDNIFNEILFLLKRMSGVDFFHYKSATINRRIARRMLISHQDTLESYLEALKVNPWELEALYQDVLISVTRFFRDPETFNYLQTDVFSNLVQNRSDEKPLRIWVPACSTGEEIYSLVIVLIESLGDVFAQTSVRFFGSDVNDNNIKIARLGVYPVSIEKDVSAERLERFFTRVERGYQVKPLLRDRCVFAKQNVTSDPPFSKIDLISCRNFLIYLSASLQKKVILTFHYALNPGGFLLLGPAENVSGFRDLFNVVDQKAKLYSKKQAQTPRSLEYLFTPSIPETFPVIKKKDENEDLNMSMSIQREADRVAIAKYEQPAVVINEAMEILQFRGDTNLYLRQARGTPSLNLFKMSQEGLEAELKNCINRVISSNISFKKENI